MKNSDVSNNRKYFSLCDMFVVLVVMCVAVVGFVRLFAHDNAQSLVAVVKVGGEVTHRISLDDVQEPYEYTVEGEFPVVLRVCGDSVCFVRSECADKLCVNTGVLLRAGQSAVCLPARVSVTLVSEGCGDESMPDAIVG